jgi:fluoride exporter
MNSALLVLAGSGVGGVLRYGVNVVMSQRGAAAFPFHTLTVNVVGSLMMGLLAAYYVEKGDAAESWRLLLMTGVLGGFTTFSAFSLDVATLYRNGDFAAAAGYTLASVAGSLAAVFTGLYVMHLRGS